MQCKWLTCFSCKYNDIALIKFRKSLVYFRGRGNPDTIKEFHSIVDAKKLKKLKNNTSKRSFLSIVKSEQFWRPFTCVGGIMVLFKSSGIRSFFFTIPDQRHPLHTGYSIISHYTAPFLDRTGISLDPLLASVVLGIFRLGCSVSTFALASIFSKRTLMYICAATGTLCQLLGSNYIKKLLLIILH